MPPPPSPPQCVDTVIVGSGPAALILSFILHGHVPHYKRDAAPHPDALLHAKLPEDLCHVDNTVGSSDLAAHFEASRISYSTAALPINVLLDTLLRPLADTEPGAYNTCVEWREEPLKAVPHRVIGDTPPGGMWATNPVPASADIGALSYVEQLSLPGYSFEEHLVAMKRPQRTEYTRPTRREVAEYLAAYPAAVGVSDSIAPVSKASGIRRVKEGFMVESHNLMCRHLVLASGTFSSFIQPEPQLRALLGLPAPCGGEPPLLVVGSGFTAADIIMSQLSKRRILHVFRWDPESRPSPLQACHKSAYPDYASVYRRMKKAAISALGEDAITSPLTKARSNPFFDSRDLDGRYEGFPNAHIEESSVEGTTGRVKVKLHDGTVVERTISGVQYVVGRRGSLKFLDKDLQSEILRSKLPKGSKISGRTLRDRVAESTEIAPNVFVIGSLAGDSLIRFAYGTCVSTAGKIMAWKYAGNPGPSQCPEPTRTRGDEDLTTEEHTFGFKTKKSRAMPTYSGLETFWMKRKLNSIVGDTCTLQ